MSDTPPFHPDGALRARVVVDGEVLAENIIAIEFGWDAIDASSRRHRAIAEKHLAAGSTVRLESLNMDGSLYNVIVLEP